MSELEENSIYTASVAGFNSHGEVIFYIQLKRGLLKSKDDNIHKSECQNKLVSKFDTKLIGCTGFCLRTYFDFDYLIDSRGSSLIKLYLVVVEMII